MSNQNHNNGQKKSNEVLCYKVTFTEAGKPKKVVKIKEMKIKDYNRAMSAAAPLIPKNAPNFQVEFILSIELMKILIIEIDGQRPDPVKIEDLDNYFSEREFQHLGEVIREIRGNVGDEKSPLKTSVEVVTG